MTTPAKVRSALKRAGTPYDIFKTEKCWFVCGGNSSQWVSVSLNVFTLNDFTTEEVVDMILELEKDNAPKQPS